MIMGTVIRERRPFIQRQAVMIAWWALVDNESGQLRCNFR